MHRINITFMNMRGIRCSRGERRIVSLSQGGRELPTVRMAAGLVEEQSGGGGLFPGD